MPDDVSTPSDEPIPASRVAPDPDDLEVAEYEYDSPSGMKLTAQLTKKQAEAMGAKPVKAAGSSTKARTSSNK